jgi:hypothetical protein
MLTILVVLGVLAAACQPSDGAATGEDPPERLVVATTDGAVVVHAADGTELVRVDPPDGSVLRQPTWLDASSIVYSEVSGTGGHALTAASSDTGEVLWRSALDTPPFYFSPAPPGSPFATTSLRNNPNGAGLIAELIGHSGEVEQISTDSPFYTAWKPDGAELAVHITGVRLDVRDGGDAQTIASPTGLFQSPAWIEDGLVLLRLEGDKQTLAVWNDEEFRDIARVDGPAGFVASGDRIAIQAAERSDPDAIQAGLRVQEIPVIPNGRLTVMDLADGTAQPVTNARALMYQWDQAGDRLLYAMAPQSAPPLEWHLWEDGTNVEVADFDPQPDWFGSFVPFFDQYAQSVQMWSPSGDRIAYPSVQGGEPVVVIHSLDSSGPIVISGAVWASWEPVDPR